ncbi:GNAT family N-acetyltransferase [Pelomonas sp. KK5]|uniref:GNAT family N-acetyltransferase n=1 Tax=Pelomonas sp. KK5 TaxID=1855730 RepID=UPI001301C559|nr:hypothetical protein [Pelomonas sp. KK5]
MIAFRMARPDDAAACARLDGLAWGAEAAASEERLRARILAHPFGNLVAEADGAIVGSVWTVCSHPREIATWAQAIGAEDAGASLTPFGELVVGVNIAVEPSWLARGLTQALIERIGALCFAAGKRTLVFFPPVASEARVASACVGGRPGRVTALVPGYFRHADNSDLAARVEWSNPELP